MKRTKVNLSVTDSAESLTKSLQEKGFKLFCDIDHQANANGVDLEMPASRVLIFGNPVAGTKLMQVDIAMSLDLPLRIAIVDIDGETLIIHQTSEDYCRNYQVEHHPVLKKVEELFATLVSEI
ncbi:MAG: hypothetical protein COA54_00920 [Thiotrichaceae bacterium]|nr:MAG: hypothetical protein COA54_00920 [Thiotrichaceae bacterium]